MTLIPYVAFSTFHTVTFTRSDIVPAISPPSEDLSLAKKVSQLLGSFVTEYQGKALRIAAFAEVWIIMPYLCLSIIFGSTSILTPLLYGNFLRFRHFYSPLTKEAMRDLRIKFDGWTADPRVPEFGRNIYTRFRDFLTGLDVSSQAQQQQEKEE